MTAPEDDPRDDMTAEEWWRGMGGTLPGDDAADVMEAAEDFLDGLREDDDEIPKL